MRLGFSEKPIILTIYGADCPDLTMIDLPGITRIALKGTQQENMNVEAITKDMARSFCSDERTIILCVVPANQDLSTSDGLQMARELDPEGKRTLGVLTKVTQHMSLLDRYHGPWYRCEEDIVEPRNRIEIGIRGCKEQEPVGYQCKDLIKSIS